MEGFLILDSFACVGKKNGCQKIVFFECKQEFKKNKDTQMKRLKKRVVQSEGTL